MGIVVKRSVRVKVVVTEQFKECRLAELRAALPRLDEVARRLGVQLESHAVSDSIKERLCYEQNKTNEAKAALYREIEKVSSLEIGLECDGGVIEGEVEIGVGDDFSRIGACEIVVRNGKVVEIRNGTCRQINETLL